MNIIEPQSFNISLINSFFLFSLKMKIERKDKEPQNLRSLSVKDNRFSSLMNRILQINSKYTIHQKFVSFSMTFSLFFYLFEKTMYMLIIQNIYIFINSNFLSPKYTKDKVEFTIFSNISVNIVSLSLKNVNTLSGRNN